MMFHRSQGAHPSPPRPDSPPLSDEAWELIRSCWVREASERPRIEVVVEKMVAISQSVVLTLAPDTRDPSYSKAPSRVLESMPRKLGTDIYHDIPPYPPLALQTSDPDYQPIPQSMRFSWALVMND